MKPIPNQLDATMKISSTTLLPALIIPLLSASSGFQLKPIIAVESLKQRSSLLKACSQDRRCFLITGASLLLTPKLEAKAEIPDDLTFKMYNADGSLKQDIDTEAKFRTVEFTWDDKGPSDALSINVDGANQASTQPGSTILLSYQLPEKYTVNGQEKYFDRTEGVNAKACNRITVYRAPGTMTVDRLEKASTVGIAKALDVTEDMKQLEDADLISGRTSTRSGQRYFEFDMAIAPASCSSSNEDLGLGFCPYNSIYLLSSTIFNDRLYVLAIECDKNEWKRANSDLKRLRSSFAVRSAA